MAERGRAELPGMAQAVPSEFQSHRHHPKAEGALKLIPSYSHGHPGTFSWQALGREQDKRPTCQIPKRPLRTRLRSPRRAHPTQQIAGLALATLPGFVD